ncbi:MAG: flap endonuclease-1 [Candidatus Bathyarchaeia archaeon]
MGVDLKDLVSRREITLEDLTGRCIAVDAYNTLYQFLAIIRQPTGEPLKDRDGRVTSHLSGLLYRNANLMEKGVRLVYVFDGNPPLLKDLEIRRRMKIKEEALAKYEDALKRGDLTAAKSYAQMTSHIKDEMLDDARKLLDLMGIPSVQAPSEGEAQAAYMVMKGDAWATASQDYDSLLFGSKRLVRNLALVGKRKLPRKNVYVEVSPELVELDMVLSELGVTREQLVDIGILVGTDFNPEGVRSIGPKTALKILKEYGSLEKALPSLKGAEGLRDLLPLIRDIFLKPEVSDNYKLEWKPPDSEGIIGFLCEERDFDEERVRNALNKAAIGFQKIQSKGTLDAWFK